MLQTLLRKGLVAVDGLWTNHNRRSCTLLGPFGIAFTYTWTMGMGSKLQASILEH